MGTRHLICVMQNGIYKIAQYGQWDGYPSGHGVDALNFLIENPDNIIALEQGLDNTYRPTRQEIIEMYAQVDYDPGENDGWIPYEKEKRFSNIYPSLSRDTGSDILTIVAKSNKPVPLKFSTEFARDSLFCEYAYVIDLDKRTFEVYRGFNKEPLDENERFYIGDNNESRINDYYPVRFLTGWSLDELPSQDDFLTVIEEKLQKLRKKDNT